MAVPQQVSAAEAERRRQANAATATKGTQPAPPAPAATLPPQPGEVSARLGQTTADGQGRSAPNNAQGLSYVADAQAAARLASTGGDFTGDPYQLAYKQGDSYYDANNNRFDYKSGADLSNSQLAVNDALGIERDRLAGEGQNVNAVYDRGAAEQQGIVDQYLTGADPRQTIDPAIYKMQRIAGANGVVKGAADAVAIGNAQGNQQELLDRVLSGPSSAKAVAEQMAAEQRAQALSARGGAGAVQAAQQQAANNAPKLQQQAALSAIQETNARQQVAAGLTGQQAQTALGAEQNNIRIQESNQQAATALINNVAALKGIEANITSQEKVALGQLQRDLAAWKTQNEAVWAQMNADDRRAFLAQSVQMYGIANNSATGLALGRLNDDDALGFFTATTSMLGQAAPKPPGS
jgi:hypothetical protein